MRLWSLHPKYLDTAGLNGLWREACMARNALEQGESHGYYNHPQLERFKKANLSIESIYTYLYYVKQEADKRDFNFTDQGTTQTLDHHIPVTNQQLDFEEGHLLDKLKQRDSIEEHNNLTVGQRFLDTHPLFYVINGPVEDWEKGGNND